MKILTAVVKTACEKANSSIYRREVKSAQKKAYKSACKKANGKYDKNWQSNYRNALKTNTQKAKERKELRSIFISSI